MPSSDQLTTDEKRQFMKQDRMLSLNDMDRDQLLSLARTLADTLMETVPDKLVEQDWAFLYEDVWQWGMDEIHSEDYEL